MYGKPAENAPPIEGDAWPKSTAYLRGVELFNAGYYWEAHEAWEALWHAHGRLGPTATVLKGLIKLAAAGVKIREGRAYGARTLALRAAAHFADAAESGSWRLGLDLMRWAKHAESVAQTVFEVGRDSERSVLVVFSFLIEPSNHS